MSTKDSAEDKLIASIQKTKAQAAGQTETAGKQATKTTAQKAAPKKAATKKKAAASTKPSRSAQSNKEQLVDMFQHGRRVWPD